MSGWRDGERGFREEMGMGALVWRLWGSSIGFGNGVFTLRESNLYKILRKESHRRGTARRVEN